ncbi:DUF4335 domain-containing protein [Tychonema sp. BBK16]|uniref:DUF4335 domain-containing protein n=1 Tax=Tychonema sp. BBK16 TaxID=2699888 RepID=UPI001F36DE28|nr:DUF4335 domain-containing protein [Tychonema sp. BBK16]MCF6374037.1 DUF4335 domain-containing protein [Tychonema sp. BBK16]
MTIRRQYSLPNCTLVLEGLSDGSAASQLDMRPVLSILMSAECYVSGLAEPLTGGRDFFESLVRVVSSYAQEFMSGVHYPDRHDPDSALVQLHKIDGNWHRLTVLTVAEGSGIQIGEKTQHSAEIDLTTIQLFDLVEAIDQFFADSQTLPELSLQLTPVSKRYIKSAEPLAQRVLPAAVGVSSLAIAAIAFFLMAVPEVQRPRDPVRQSNSTGQNIGTPSPGGATPNPNPTPSASGLLPDDRTQSPLPTASTPGETASPTPGETPSPTPSETASPTPGETPSPTPGETPAADASPSVTPTPMSEGLQSSGVAVAITDPAEIEQLKGKLSKEIEGVLKGKAPVEGELVYRVSVGKDGAIVGYKSQNTQTVDRIGETLFSDLLYKPVGTRPPAEPLADFRVVFAPGGAVQVSPW